MPRPSRDPVGPETGAFLGHLQARQQAPEAADPLLDRRLPIDEPPVLGLAETDALARARGDDIRDPKPPLVADAPLSEAVGLHQPGHEPPAVLHRRLSVGDDEEV